MVTVWTMVWCRAGRGGLVRPWTGSVAAGILGLTLLTSCSSPGGQRVAATTPTPVPTSNAPQRLETSADVAWDRTGADPTHCGNFTVTFTYKAPGAAILSKVKGRTLTIKLSAHTGKTSQTATVPGGPLDGEARTQAFDDQGVVSFKFRTLLAKGTGFVSWAATAVNPPVDAPLVGAGRAC